VLVFFVFMLVFLLYLQWIMVQCILRQKKKLLKEVSYYTTHLRLRKLRENRCTMSEKYKECVKTVECREGEPICCDESSDLDGPFCYFYATFFKKVLLRLHLSIFEKELLTELNVAPAQLHPNSWAFIQAFIILCSKLGISPTVEVFLYFSEAKHTSCQMGVPKWCRWKRFPCPLPIFNKFFKGKFVKVRASTGDPILLDEFPLYWTLKPKFQSARRLEDLFSKD